MAVPKFSTALELLDRADLVRHVHEKLPKTYEEALETVEVLERFDEFDNEQILHQMHSWTCDRHNDDPRQFKWLLMAPNVLVDFLEFGTKAEFDPVRPELGANGLSARWHKALVHVVHEFPEGRFYSIMNFGGGSYTTRWTYKRPVLF